MDIQEELGQRIKFIRGARRMTQETLALEAGITRTHLIRIERGKFSARVDLLHAIAKALNIKLKDLFDGVG